MKIKKISTEKMKLKIFFILIAFMFSLNFISAVVVSDVSQKELFPGEQTSLEIELKNNLEEDVEDVSFNLVMDNTPFISIGGSEKSFDEIRDGKSRALSITIKASQGIKPGDYNIPYILSYTDKDEKRIVKNGSIGVIVSAKTELSFSAETENNVIGENGKISLKIVNSGFGDIKFVNIKIGPSGFTLIGSDSDYIGTIDSDDFEVATFNVIFNDENARLMAVVEYKDFDNNQHTENIDIPIKVYSRDEAIKLGIIKKSYTFIYIGVVITLILVWIFYKMIKKARKKISREE